MKRTLPLLFVSLLAGCSSSNTSGIIESKEGDMQESIATAAAAGNEYNGDNKSPLVSGAYPTKNGATEVRDDIKLMVSELINERDSKLEKAELSYQFDLMNIAVEDDTDDKLAMLATNKNGLEQLYKHYSIISDEKSGLDHNLIRGLREEMINIENKIKLNDLNKEIVIIEGELDRDISLMDKVREVEYEYEKAKFDISYNYNYQIESLKDKAKRQDSVTEKLEDLRVKASALEKIIEESDRLSGVMGYQL